MRYREGDSAPTIYEQSEGLQLLLTFSISLGVLVGVALVFLGWHGRILWLKVWGAGLILVSAGYLVGKALGYA